MKFTQKINPDKQIPATQQNINKLLEAYGLTLQNFELADSGIENTTIFVDCAEGKFVLRVYRQLKKADEHVKQEVSFVHYLHDKGVKVPRVVQNKDGELLTKAELDGVTWQVILMDFVAGHHAASYSPVLLKDMAEMQARMHLISPDFSDHYYGFVLRELREKHFIQNIDLDALSDSRLLGFLERAKAYRVSLSKDLPFGLCHLDYDKDNILVTKNGSIAAVLDFDDVALAPFIVDLAYTLWHVRYYADEATADEYLARYEKLRPLSDIERSSIKPIMLFRHYVLCSLGILEGESDQAEIDKYLTLEKSLASETS